MRKNINDAIFFSKKIFKFCIHFEPQFFQNFVTRFFFFIGWHFVEQNFSSFFQKGLCPSQNIVDICSCARCDNIKFSGKIRIFGEYLCSLLNGRNIFQPQFFNKKIHRANFFSNAVKQCNIQFWTNNFERNPRKSASRANIEYFYICHLKFM